MSTEEVVKVIEALGERERTVILMQAQRLLHGQSQYGELQANDSRNFLREAVEECLDAAVYLTIQVLELQESEESND